MLVYVCVMIMLKIKGTTVLPEQGKACVLEHCVLAATLRRIKQMGFVLDSTQTLKRSLYRILSNLNMPFCQTLTCPST